MVELYTLCQKKPSDWDSVPDISLPPHLTAFTDTLKRVDVPSGTLPSDDVPKAAERQDCFIAVKNGRQYYVDKGASNYYRYMLAIHDDGGLVRFTIKKGETMWSPVHGEMTVERLHLCTFPTDNDREGVVYYCKKVKP